MTVVDIARDAGVSKSTVSLVLQGSPLVRPATKERVRAAMERLGYVYHRGAASLRRRTSDVVGMVINDLTNPFFAELAVGIERVLQQAGVVPFLANTGENPIRQIEVVRSMREHGAAGFILCPAVGTTQAFMTELEAWRLPVVTVMRKVAGSRATAVTPANRRGARQAVEHLLALGHRRIAFAGGRAGMAVQEERCGGYIDALRGAGLPADPTLVVESLPNRAGGREVLARLLALPEPPTAALCFNDVVAFGVMNALTARGLQPGRELAVVGFDDVTDAAHVAPALSTVRVDVHGLGEKAAQTLLQRLRQPTLSMPDIEGEVMLVVRASCGALRAGPRQGEAA